MSGKRGKSSDEKNFKLFTCHTCSADFSVQYSGRRKTPPKFCSSKCFGINRSDYFKKIFGGDLRVCNRCKIKKSTDDFSPDSRISHKRQRTCKPCKSEWMRLDRIKNPERYKSKDLMAYGINLEDYKVREIQQSGQCAICKTENKCKSRKYLYVDHDHSTGEVRGLLCGPCNSAIGLMKEDEEILRSAINYLQRSKSCLVN